MHAASLAGEILKINRLVFPPDAAPAAKVGDARVGADAGADEKDNSASLSYLRGEFLQLHLGCAGLKGELLCQCTNSPNDLDTSKAKRIGHMAINLALIGSCQIAAGWSSSKPRSSIMRCASDASCPGVVRYPLTKIEFAG